MKYKINSVFIVISVVIGIIFGIVNEFMPVYNNWALGVPMMLITMAMFAVVMSVVLIIRGMASGAFRYAGKTIALAMVFVIALVGFTGLFELLYEFKADVEITPGYVEYITTTTTTSTNNQGNGTSQNNQNGTNTNATTTVTSTGYTTAGTYVFLIDNSDSMNHPTLGNDPEGMRFTAVENAINHSNVQAEYYVYLFGTDVIRDAYFDARPVEEYFVNRNSAVDGETYLMSAIDTIVDDVKNNSDTNIILLTDGEPNDMAIYDEVVRKCVNNNVHVSCVGFGDADEAFLEKLATDTFGAWAFADDVNNLIVDVGTVIEYTTTSQVPANNNASTNTNQNTSSNNLYPGNNNSQTTTNTTTNVTKPSISTTRTPVGNLLGTRWGFSILHIFLRILFLVILGLIWALAKALLVGDTQFNLKLAIITFVVSIIGTIMLEVMLLIGIPSSLARIFFFATWALTIVPEYYDDYRGGSNIDLGGYTPLDTTAASDLWNTPKDPGGTNSFL